MRGRGTQKRVGGAFYFEVALPPTSVRVYPEGPRCSIESTDQRITRVIRSWAANTAGDPHATLGSTHACTVARAARSSHRKPAKTPMSFPSCITILSLTHWQSKRKTRTPVDAAGSTDPLSPPLHPGLTRSARLDDC